MSEAFQARLENWSAAIRGNCGPEGTSSPTYTAMIALRKKFGPADDDAWTPTFNASKTIDWKDAEILTSAFIDQRLAKWDKNLLVLRYGCGSSDKSLARRFHVGERWICRRRQIAESNFQRIVEEVDMKLEEM